MWLDLFQTALDGVMVGGLYATVALGITLVFGLVGILNFAHGQMVMLGAYVAFFSTLSGFPFWWDCCFQPSAWLFLVPYWSAASSDARLSILWQDLRYHWDSS